MPGTILSYFRRGKWPRLNDPSTDVQRTPTNDVQPTPSAAVETTSPANVVQPTPIAAVETVNAQPSTSTDAPQTPPVNVESVNAQPSTTTDALQTPPVNVESVNAQPSTTTDAPQTPPVNTHSAHSSLPPDIGSKESGPSQPILPVFPVDPAILRRYTKSFQKSWYIRHKWICYSIVEDKVYCFCCIFFSTNASGSGDPCFVQYGFNKWAKAVGDKRKGLDKHALSESHRNAQYMWETYQSNGISIVQRLSTHREELVYSNRQYFSILIKHMRYLAVQEISYRHLDENDDTAVNQGNYIQLLLLQLETNPTFKKLRESILKQYSIHKDYWSKTIANEFIEYMADAVREEIAKEISNAGMFFLVIDECKDRAGHEQLSICVRFCEGSVAKERFLGLIRLSEDFSAAAIVALLLPFISLLNTDAVFLGLTTDGASVLFGIHSGVAARLREVYSWILNLHCTAHRLNLIVGKLALRVFPRTLSILKQLHSCFNALKTGDVFEVKQRERNERARKIPGYIEVRWESLFDLLLVVSERFQTTLITLAECSQDDDIHATVCAGLYHKMANSVFVEEVLIFYKVMALLQSLSKILQQESINWHQACAEIRLTQTALTALDGGNQHFIQKIITDTKKICNDCSIPINVSSDLFNTRLSASQNNNPEDEGDSGMQQRVQEKVSRLVTTVSGFFRDRYPPATMKILEGLDALDPSSEHYMSFEKIVPLLDQYGQHLEISAGQVEMEMLKYNSGAGLAEINHVSCPCIMKLIRFRNTIAVSSAQAERSFSCMNRVKTKLRNLLSDERTSDLTLLAFEKELTMAVSTDKIIDAFATKKPRRVPLQN